MKQADIRQVKFEIQRLLVRLDNLDKKAFHDKNQYFPKRSISETTNSLLCFGCAETGAIRRASMDLTRALSEMRKA